MKNNRFCKYKHTSRPLGEPIGLPNESPYQLIKALRAHLILLKGSLDISCDFISLRYYLVIDSMNLACMYNYL